MNHGSSHVLVYSVRNIPITFFHCFKNFILYFSHLLLSLTNGSSFSSGSDLIIVSYLLTYQNMILLLYNSTNLEILIPYSILRMIGNVVLFHLNNMRN